MKKIFVFSGFVLVMGLAIWFQGGISIQADFSPSRLSRPSLLSPSDNANISAPPIILDWSDVSGAGVYIYEYWNSFDNIHHSGSVTLSEFQPVDVDIIWGFDYRWKVRACVGDSLSSCSLWTGTDSFKTVGLSNGTINTVNSSKWKPELLSRSICTGNASAGTRCKEVYDSCHSDLGKVDVRCHLTLAASFWNNFNYNIYFIDPDDGKSAPKTVELGDVLKLKIEKPEGEWFFSGGSFDSPPITWISDAQTAYKNMVSIEPLYEYKVNANKFDNGAQQILKPKMGLAASEPLKQAGFSVKSNDNLEVFEQAGDYYIKAIKPGIGTVDVNIPSVFAYSTIDNLWFEDGFITGAADNFTFSVNVPPPPNAPSSFIGSAVCVSGNNPDVNLSWTEDSLYETGFEIYRGEAANFTPGAGNKITAVAANVTVYTDTSPSPSTTYYYKIRAISNYGNSDYTTSSEIKTDSCSSSNSLPSINAGADKSLNEDTAAVFSDASASDADGDSLTYEWICTGGALSSSSVLNPNYTAPAVNADTNYTCSLKVDDGRGGLVTDDVLITVKNVKNCDPSDESPTKTKLVSPANNANNVPTGKVTLDWDDSTDKDSKCDSIVYDVYFGNSNPPPIVASGTNIISSSFDVNVSSAGVYYWQVVAKDQGGNKNSSSTWSFTAVVINNSPIANAGSDQSVKENSAVALDGSSSGDLDGDTLTYSWAQTVGTVITLSGNTTVNPTFTAPLVSSGSEILTFRLTVNDGRGGAASDNVNVTVNDSAVPVTATLRISPSTTTLRINQTFQFEAWYDPDGDGVDEYKVTRCNKAGANPDYVGDNSKNCVGPIAWNTSNNGIAKVNNGIVTAVDRGNATISAIYNGIASGSNATVRVVRYKWEEK